MLRELTLMGLAFSGVMFLAGLSASGAGWTAMIYIDGDNNLDYLSDVEFDEIRDSDADLDVLVLKDDASNGDTHLYHVRNGTTIELSPDWLDSEENMGSRKTLEDFVRWTLENYSANHTLLCLWDHGGSFVGCCVDDTNGHDILTLKEMRDALNASLDIGEKIDVIAFADCLMASTEVCYDLKDVAHYIVGSEKVGWAYYTEALNWDFDDIINYLEDQDDPAEVASYIVENAMDLEWYMESESHTWSALNVSKMSELVDQLDCFAEDLINCLSDHHFEIARARLRTESYEGPYGGYYRRIVDLYHFAENIHADDSLPAGLRNSADDLMTSINGTVIAEGHHTSDDGSDEPCDHAHGLSIHLPEKRSHIWWYYSNPLLGPALFTRDTLWDEFLSHFTSYLFVDDDNTGYEDGTLRYPHNTVQEAIDIAHTGDTIHVFEGVYSGDVVVNQCVNLTGNGTDQTTIEGGGAGDVMSITVDGVHVSGFRITGGGFGLSGIKVDSDRVMISDVNCSDCWTGIDLNSTCDVHVDGCEFWNDTHALYVRNGSAYSAVHNSTFGENVWNVFNSVAHDINCTHNYWGTIDEVQIRNSIHDRLDNAALGSVLYSPWYDATFTNLYYSDLQPPVTTDDYDGLWHRTDVTIRLNATDVSAVNVTYYRIDGGAWNIYSSPIVIPAPDDHSNDGNHTVEYYSIDRIGNAEELRSVVVHIDTRSPEFRVWFDPSSKRMMFSARDELDPAPDCMISWRSGRFRIYHLQDHAGNTAAVKLRHMRWRVARWRIHEVRLKWVSYNGGPIHRTDNTVFTSRFLVRSGAIKVLRERVSSDLWSVRIRYAQTRERTRLWVLDDGLTFRCMKGMRTLELITIEGEVRYRVT